MNQLQSCLSGCDGGQGGIVEICIRMHAQKQREKKCQTKQASRLNHGCWTFRIELLQKPKLP